MRNQDRLIPNFKPFIPKESIKEVRNTLTTTWIGGDGPKVKQFEEELTQVIQNKNVVAVNSGTSALQLALRLANAKGGEVITSPMTCFATSAAIVSEGAVPIWTDIDPKTGNIDPNEIEKKITKKTKAIMVVHWGGAPAELDKINKIASIYNLPVIEDAAQALGSEYNDKPIGSHSDFIAFSFQAIKIINTGDGGLLTTKKKRDANRGRKLRWYGIDRQSRSWDKKFSSWEYPITEVGMKAQMTDISASIGIGQLPYLEKLLEHRRKLAKIYEEALTKSTAVKAQKILPNSKSNYFMFTVICANSQIKEKLWRNLNKINVKAEVAHRRNDLYPVFEKADHPKLPGVDKFDQNHLIIPVGYWVSTKKAKEIAEVLSKF